MAKSSISKMLPLVPFCREFYEWVLRKKYAHLFWKLKIVQKLILEIVRNTQSVPEMPRSKSLTEGPLSLKYMASQRERGVS